MCKMNNFLLTKREPLVTVKRLTFAPLQGKAPPSPPDKAGDGEPAAAALAGSGEGLAVPNGFRTRTGHAGIAQLIELEGIQAAGWRPTVPIPAIPDSGRAPSTDTPPPCRGTPGRIAAAITLAARAGLAEAAADIIAGLKDDPAREDVVYALALSSAMATACRPPP